MKNSISCLIKKIFAEVNKEIVKILNFKNNEKKSKINEEKILINNNSNNEKKYNSYIKEDDIINVTNFQEERIDYTEFKNENTDIVLGIIGFNVDAHQNKVLKEIANAANGYYSSANDAAKLTEELQRIHEIAFSDYKWEPLNDSMINRIIASHNLTLTMNKFLIERSLGEKNNMSSLIMYGSKSYSNDSKFAGLYEFNGKISKKLKALSEERREKIKALYKTEFEKIEKQSQDYIAQIKARKGATVAYIPTTSRKNPMSKYWSGHGGKGGTIKDSKKDNEELRKEQTVK